MATTLSALRTQVTDELKMDPNQRINSTAVMNRAIIRALRRIQQDAGHNLPYNVTTTTITPDTQEENLPSDFRRIAEPNGVKSGSSTSLAPVEYTALVGFRDLTISIGTPSMYYVRHDGTNWIIGFEGVPSSSQVLTIPYLKKLTEMSADSDESPLPEEYDMMIVDYAVFLILRRIKGFERKAAEYLQFYNDEISSLTSNELVALQGALRFGYQRANHDQVPNPRGIS